MGWVAEQVAVNRFPFTFSTGFRLAGLPFGILPVTSGVVLDNNTFTARLGFWRVRTPLANVRSATLSGPFSLMKTAGPARLSLADRGLTFATNPDQGVCVQFHESVSGVDPLGMIRHPGLTVTVADCSGLVRALSVAVTRNPR